MSQSKIASLSLLSPPSRRRDTGYERSFPVRLRKKDDESPSWGIESEKEEEEYNFAIQSFITAFIPLLNFLFSKLSLNEKQFLDHKRGII